MPFSIPLEIDNNTVSKEGEGIYLVSMKITYNDDLRVPHELIVNKEVNLELKHNPSGNEAQNLDFIFGTHLGLIGIIIITITAIAAYYYSTHIHYKENGEKEKTKVQAL